MGTIRDDSEDETNLAVTCDQDKKAIAVRTARIVEIPQNAAWWHDRRSIYLGASS